MNKSQLTLIINAFLILWTFCYLIASFVAAHQCYYIEDKGDTAITTNPSDCVEGDGVATLYQVGDDKVFQSVVTGLVTFIHAIYTLWALKTGKVNSRLLTLLLGMSYMIIIMLLISAVFWGGQNLLEQEFVVHGNETGGAGSGTSLERHYYPNKALISTFAAECAFSVLALLCEIGMAYSLTFWSDELIADGGGGYGGYDNFSSGGANPAPYEAPKGGEPSQYNDL